MRLSSGVVTLARYKIEFWIDGRPLAATDFARNPATLVSDTVAEHLLALAPPGQRLILAPSSDEVKADGTSVTSDQLTTQQSLYLEYVLPGKDLDHAWLTWRGDNEASVGDLLLSLREGDAREVVRRHFGAPGFVSFILGPAQLAWLKRELAAAFTVGTPTYYLEGLTPGGLVVQESDDGCALSIYTADVSEEELLARLRLLLQ